MDDYHLDACPTFLLAALQMTNDPIALVRTEATRFLADCCSRNEVLAAAIRLYVSGSGYADDPPQVEDADRIADEMQSSVPLLNSNSTKALSVPDKKHLDKLRRKLSDLGVLQLD